MAAKYIFVAAAALLCRLWLSSATHGTANAVFPEENLYPNCTQMVGETAPHFSPDGIEYPSWASDGIWASGTSCGKIYCLVCKEDLSRTPQCMGRAAIYVEVKGPCPGCATTFSVSVDGFGAMADPRSGLVELEYSLVEDANAACG